MSFPPLFVDVTRFTPPLIAPWWESVRWQVSEKGTTDESDVGFVLVFLGGVYGGGGRERERLGGCGEKTFLLVEESKDIARQRTSRLKREMREEFPPGRKGGHCTQAKWKGKGYATDVGDVSRRVDYRAARVGSRSAISVHLPPSAVWHPNASHPTHPHPFRTQEEGT